MTQSTSLSLSRLVAVMEVFRSVDPEIQAQTVLTFLMIARQPGIPMRTIQTRLDVASSTASRNVAYLSDLNYKPSRKGHGFVVAREDPADRRNKLVFLTPKGKKFLQNLETAMSGETYGNP